MITACRLRWRSCVSLFASFRHKSLEPSGSTMGSLLTALRERWRMALALLRALEPPLLYGPKGREVSVTWDAGLKACHWHIAVLLLAGDPGRGPFKVQALYIYDI